jgi:hypothetical protein
VLGVEHTVIDGVELEAAGPGEVLVARVRPTRSRAGRCGHSPKALIAKATLTRGGLCPPLPGRS